ncbi:hypothetical protein KKE03_00600 [Patescibacteria group bacterium]|nr:hypothetical protein [Patescibacteria group bacterium]
MNDPIIEFNPKLPKLSKNEKEVLKLLVEAGRLIVPIYKEQEKQPSFSKEEIEKAAKGNPAILSPYTIVEKVNGKLIAIPYHKKYAELLKPIAEKLEQAAEITENKEFGSALRIQAKTLLDGSYEKATAVWLKMEPYILDISIGPLHHSDDRLEYGKASYHAWVGVLDKEGTERLNNYKTITLSASRKAPGAKEQIYPKKIKAIVLDEVLFAGIMARTKFVGLNLPVDLSLVEKYGVQVTLFNQVNDLRMKKQIIPTFDKIFSAKFREEFNLEDLRRGSLRYVALHELSHNYLYFKNSAKNLQDLFICIYELAATVLGIRLAGSLLLLDRITNKQLESMIVAFISRSFDLVEKYRKNKFLKNYASGGAIFINFMLESGALKQKEGMAIPNFMKIFVSLHELSYITERLLSSGTRKDAEVFIHKYS